MKSLARVIRIASGQDISRCQGCFDCDVHMPNERDIPLGGLIQLALMDDEESLVSRTLWSDSVLDASHCACSRGIDLHAVILALREEAEKRNIIG
ncbi:MAG: hypothetical protein HYZ24_09980 [Chloroflexi bacterium]|nr:hypothetical protein [Chloroflexota bacterium]